MSDNIIYKAAIIISSDRAYNGTYEDKSGPAARAWFDARPEAYLAQNLTVIPDDKNVLASRLDHDLPTSDVIVISGGTGLGPRDITPQTLDEYCDYQIPGLGEMLRAESLKYSLNAYLSRCGGWVKGDKLILALPGNSKAVVEQLDIVADLLPHALDGLKGRCKHRRKVKND